MVSVSLMVSLLCLGDQILLTQGFAPRAVSSVATSSSSLNSMPDPSSFLDSAAIASSSSWLLSTIDADIANIPENEFKPVFMGGLVVMFGGLVSALIVGFILEQKDLYASVVADSYAQGAQDEEFWKGLSEEEKKKTQELLAKLKEGKNDSNDDGQSAPQEEISTPVTVSESQIEEAETPSPNPTPVVASEEREPVAAGKKDMFSDY